MKCFLFFVNICIAFVVNGQRAPEGSSSIPFEQQKKIWLNEIENQEYSTFDLMPENFKTEFSHYDFSSLFIPKDEFLGYIGTDYQRIKIAFTNIKKTAGNEDIYEVNGNSDVKNNRCKIKGSIQIDQIRKYKQIQPGVDSSLVNAGLKAEGILIGNYSFKEDSSQTHSGIFSGIMMLFWYIDKSGALKFDDIEWGYSDGYCNDLFVGTWKTYNGKTTKVCNWGMFRIPFSGDLDIGAGEFSPNEKYQSKGWADKMLK